MFDWKLGKGLNMGLIAAAVIGITLLLIGSLGGGGYSRSPEFEDGAENNTNDSTVIGEKIDASASELVKAEIALEQRLTDILSMVKGAGKVKVTVQLASGPEFEYAVNDKVVERKVEEEDRGGGTRLTTEKTEDGQLVLLRSSGTGIEQAVVVKEIKPRVLGVLVVASGADNILIKEKLIRALETLLDLQPNKITVLTGEGR